MPGGPGTLGIAYFAAIKFAGYTAAAAYLKGKYQRPDVNAWIVGGVRTAIGLAAGIVAVFFASQLDIFRTTPLFFVLLVPTRIAEWMFLLWLFYERPGWSWRRTIILAVLGTIWSFVLDIPAILSAFVLPGGMWIC